MDLKDQLQQLFEQHEPQLGTYAWMYETDRWTELVFCLLNQFYRQEAEPARAAMATLRYLGLLRIEKLGTLEAGSAEEAVAVYVLKQHGLSEQDARNAAGLLAMSAQVVGQRYGGKIQRYLRHHGVAMRDELVNAFAGGALDEGQLRYAISHWLQNALGLPVSLEHQALRTFCKREEVSLDELIEAADKLDLNLALVDDVLELDQAAKAAAEAGEQQRRE